MKRIGILKYSEVTEKERVAFAVLWKRRHKRSCDEAMMVLEKRENGFTLKEIGLEMGIGPQAVRVIILYAEKLIKRIRDVGPL